MAFINSSLKSARNHLPAALLASSFLFNGANAAAAEDCHGICHEKKVSENVSCSERESLSDRLVCNAESYLNVPYAQGGRGTAEHPGLDGLGLILRAYASTVGKDWTTLPQTPREMVSSEAYGRPVENLAGTLYAHTDYSKLVRGDILLFLIPVTEGVLKSKYAHISAAASEAGALLIDSQQFLPWQYGIVSKEGDRLEQIEIVHSDPDSFVRHDSLNDIYIHRLFVLRPSENFQK
ncbi:MAG TPA: hypothetical protein VJI75_03875 [Candidatus Nanoarchaeia archaeon]|nr:hypothetical protein [Candidatus Nanoarchaeia archaeon]